LYQHNELALGRKQVAGEESELQELLELPKKPLVQQWPQVTMEFLWIYTELAGLRGFSPLNS